MCRRVYFRADPVQSQSRPLCHSELHVLQGLEDHLRERHGCSETFNTSTLENMCSYCRDVSSYIMSKFDYHHGNYVEKSRHDDTLTFVEIPRALTASRRIIELVNRRNLRGRRRFSAEMGSGDRSCYSNRYEQKTGGSPLVAFYRISVRTEYGEWSTRYNEVGRAGNHEHYNLSRTAVITSATGEWRPRSPCRLHR